jgi:hypothetical protein
MLLPDHQLLPELTHLPIEMAVEAMEDETMIPDTVHFDAKDKGTPCRTDVITHLSCNCGGTDINSTYRQ